MQRVASRIKRWSERVSRETNDLPASVSTHHLAQFAVCQMIAYELELPATSVDRPKEYFIQNHVASAETTLAKINEYLVMDVKNAIDLIQRIWMSRYVMVHVPFSNEAVKAIESVLTTDSNYRVAPKYREVAQCIDGSFIRDIYHEIGDDLRQYTHAETHPQVGMVSNGA